MVNRMCRGLEMKFRTGGASVGPKVIVDDRGITIRVMRAREYGCAEWGGSCVQNVIGTAPSIINW